MPLDARFLQAPWMIASRFVPIEKNERNGKKHISSGSSVRRRSQA
jgi:hypothetical protein